MRASHPIVPSDGGSPRFIGTMTPPRLVRLTFIATNTAPTSMIGAHRHWHDDPPIWHDDPPFIGTMTPSFGTMTSSVGTMTPLGIVTH